MSGFPKKITSADITDSDNDDDTQQVSSAMKATPVAKTKAASKPKASPKTKTSAGSNADTAKPKASPKSKTSAAPNAATSKPKASPKAKTSAESNAAPKSVPKSKPESKPKPKSQSAKKKPSSNVKAKPSMNAAADNETGDTVDVHAVGDGECEGAGVNTDGDAAAADKCAGVVGDDGETAPKKARTLKDHEAQCGDTVYYTMPYKTKNAVAIGERNGPPHHIYAKRLVAKPK